MMEDEPMSDSVASTPQSTPAKEASAIASSAGGKQLSREQLLEYIKKQKLVIKRLEKDKDAALAAAAAAAPSLSSTVEAPKSNMIDRNSSSSAAAGAASGANPAADFSLDVLSSWSSSIVSDFSSIFADANAATNTTAVTAESTLQGASQTPSNKNDENQEMLDSLRLQLDDINKYADKLHKKNAVLERKNEENIEIISSNKDTVSHLTNRVMDLEKQLAESQKQISSKDSAAVVSKHHESEIKALHDIISELREKESVWTAESKTLISSLKKDLSEKDSLITASEKEIEGLRRQILELQQTDRAEDEVLNGLSSELQQKAVLVDRLGAELAAATAMIDSLSKESQDKTAKIDSLSKEINNKAAKMDSLSNELSGVKTIASDVKGADGPYDVPVSKGRRGKGKSTTPTSTAAIAISSVASEKVAETLTKPTSDELGVSRKTIIALEEKIKQLDSDIDALRLTSTSHIESLDRRIEDKDQSILDSEKKVNGFEKEAEGLRRQILELQQTDRAEDEVLNGLSSELQQKAVLVDRLGAELAAATAMIDSLSKESQDKTAKIESLAKYLDEKSKQIETIKTSLSIESEERNLQLLSRMSSLESELQKSKEVKESLEALRIKADDSDKKVAAFNEEIIKLRGDVKAKSNRIDLMDAENGAAREEREIQRRRVVEIEQTLEESAMNAIHRLSKTPDGWIDTRDLRLSITSSITGMPADPVRQVPALVSALVDSFFALNASCAVERTTNAELVEALNGAASSSSKNSDLAAMNDQLNAQIISNKKEIESCNDKIKRLKMLLAKTKSLSEEKDKDLESSAREILSFVEDTISSIRRSGGIIFSSRVKKLSMHARVAVPTTHDISAHDALVVSYCLVDVIDEECSPVPIFPLTTNAGVNKLVERSYMTGKISSSSRDSTKWVAEKDVDEWIAGGAVVVGRKPAFIHEPFESRILDLKTSLESERDQLKAELEETMTSFQTYKNRAQTALKRLGAEERNERQKTIDTENSQIETLTASIKEYEKKCNALESNLINESTASKSLGEQLEVLKKEINDLERVSSAEIQNFKNEMTFKCQKLERDLVEKENDIKILRSKESEQSLQIGKYKSDELIQRKMRDEAKNLEDIVHLLEGGSVAPNSNPTITTGHSSSSSANKFADATIVASSSSGSNSSDALHNLVGKTDKKTEKKLLLFHQADHELTESLNALRLENTALNIEINDLKSLVVLNTEQSIALKENIRELESNLFREKEFNSKEGQRLNTEYLVNILRKFFACDNASEKAKLVQVICTILHMSGDESSKIIEKFAVKQGKGLVGWFQNRNMNNNRPPTYSHADLEEKNNMLMENRF